MQGEHAQHMAHAGKLEKASKNGCNCGCHCSNTHCATSCAGLLAVGSFIGGFNIGRGSQLIGSGQTHPVAAHPLDLLRPPSLI